MENLKNECKELNGLWNMKQIQIDNTEKTFADLRPIYYMNFKV